MTHPANTVRTPPSPYAEPHAPPPPWGSPPDVSGDTSTDQRAATDVTDRMILPNIPGPVRAFIVERPVVSIVIALAAGLAVGRLASRF
jgi:hypothetical protein